MACGVLDMMMMKYKLAAALGAGLVAYAALRSRRASRRTVLSERYTQTDVEAMHAIKVRRIAAALRDHHGGAVSGCSIESMSFRFGGFHDTCLEYEVITATGDVLTCTPDNPHQLVFQMMHGSFGTLGVLAKLTFRLVPAKRFVHVVYETYA